MIESLKKDSIQPSIPPLKVCQQYNFIPPPSIRKKVHMFYQYLKLLFFITVLIGSIGIANTTLALEVNSWNEMVNAIKNGENDITLTQDAIKQNSDDNISLKLTPSVNSNLGQNRKVTISGGGGGQTSISLTSNGYERFMSITEGSTLTLKNLNIDMRNGIVSWLYEKNSSLVMENVIFTQTSDGFYQGPEPTIAT